MNSPALVQPNPFTVRESVLSDNSLVYDVLACGEEIYNALNEDDAYKLRDVLRASLRTAQAYAAGEGKGFDSSKPLHQRLSMLSFCFRYDSPEARTCEEAAKAVQP